MNNTSTNSNRQSIVSLRTQERLSSEAFLWWKEQICIRQQTKTINTSNFRIREESWTLFREKLLISICSSYNVCDCCNLRTFPTQRPNIYDIAAECGIPKELLPPRVSMILNDKKLYCC